MKSQNLYKKISKYNWEPYIKRHIDLLTLIANARANYKGNVEKIGFMINSYLYISNNEIVEYFRDRNEQDKYIRKMHDFITKNTKKIISILKEAQELNKLLQNQLNNKNQFIKSLKAKSLIGLEQVFINQYNTFQYYFVPCLTIPYYIGVVEESMGLKDNKEIKLIKQLSRKLRLKTHYPDFRNIIIKNILVEISKRVKVNFEVINVLTPEEIKKICKGKFMPEKSILKERKKFIYFRNFKKEYLIFDNKLVKKVNSLFKENKIKNIKILKGQPCYKGLVKGFAKIAYNKKDFKKFRKNDILVTINSNPSLMPVIRKCSAIIADEGGLLCHAAILSREFKIPCIIGTGNATQVLNDGDEVEVDAYQGVVKILKRAK